VLTASAAANVPTHSSALTEVERQYRVSDSKIGLADGKPAAADVDDEPVKGCLL
jgi:hypothetical protein